MIGSPQWEASPFSDESQLIENEQDSEDRLPIRLARTRKPPPTMCARLLRDYSWKWRECGNHPNSNRSLSESPGTTKRNYGIGCWIERRKNFHMNQHTRNQTGGSCLDWSLWEDPSRLARKVTIPCSEHAIGGGERLSQIAIAEMYAHGLIALEKKQMLY